MAYLEEEFGGEDSEEELPSDRIAPAVLAALPAVAQSVASIISTGGGDGSHSTYEMKDSGVRFDANDCWQDGGGACPNGNCMDNKGRKGVVIKETTVSCKWFCGWRAHCKTQLCCAKVKYMEF